MIFLLSPAKSLNFDDDLKNENYSSPHFLKESQILIKELRNYSPKDLSKLMAISDKLAQINYQRFQNFQTPFNLKNAKQALLVFDGDVYQGIQVQNYTDKDFTFAQNHLRILSGLYGLLKPLDLIQPYRLEMGINLKTKGNKNLYEFWQEKITDLLNKELAKQSEKSLVNLASEEYFNAVNCKNIKGKIINIIFKQKHKNDYKIIGLYAKKARGLMANFIIKNNIKKTQDLKDFNLDGYRLHKSDSNNLEFRQNSMG